MATLAMGGASRSITALLLLCLSLRSDAFSMPSVAFRGQGHRVAASCARLPLRLRKTAVSMSSEPDWDEGGVNGETIDTTATIDAKARAATADELKRDLLVACASSNRGFGGTKEGRDAVVALVSQLEALNPVVRPNENLDLLCGKWRLVYCTALDVLSLGVLPLTQPGEIRQDITAEVGSEDLLIENVVELQPALEPVLKPLVGSSTLQLTVKAQGIITSPTRVEISFRESKLQPISLLGLPFFDWAPPLTIPLNSGPQNAAGGRAWIETSYLDEDVRIARGGAGGAGGRFYEEGNNNVFVLWRD